MPNVEAYIARVHERRQRKIKAGASLNGRSIRIAPSVHKLLKTNAKESGTEIYELANIAITLGMPEALEMLGPDDSYDDRGNR